MRVVFMGSPAFAVPSLTRLLAEGHPPFDRARGALREAERAHSSKENQ